MGLAAERIGGKAGQALAAETHGRVLNMVAALLTIVRGRPLDDHEQAVLSACLRHLRERTPNGRAPVLPDLLRVLEEGPDRVRAVTLDRGQETRYRDAVDPLHRSLLGILDGALGDTFGSTTSTRIDLDAPAVCIDISRIGESDTQLTAAAMLAAWSDGLGTVAAAHALADAGMAPRRWFFTILDELWRPLRAASGIVDRIDALTRLNRSLGLGDAKITHTLKDAEALGTDADRAKARGFVERAGIVACAGLPAAEMDRAGPGDRPVPPGDRAGVLLVVPAGLGEQRQQRGATRPGPVPDQGGWSARHPDPGVHHRHRAPPARHQPALGAERVRRTAGRRAGGCPQGRSSRPRPSWATWPPGRSTPR